MRARQLVHTGMLIVTAQVAVAVLGVVALRCYTGLVSPSVFGATNLVTTALALGLQLFVAGFVAAQLRFYSEAEQRGAADEFTRRTMVLALRAGAVLVVVATIALVPLRLTGVFSCSVALIASGAAWVFSMIVRNVLISRIQAQRRQASYAKLQVVEAALQFGVTIVALYVAPTVESFLWGQCVGNVLLLTILFAREPQARTIFARRTRTDGGFGPKAWAYGAPFVPLSFLSWLANLGDRYTLASMLGSQSAGLYVAPFSIASRGMMLSNSALCDLFRPILFDAANRHDASDANRAFVLWLLCSLALSSVGLVIVYCAGPMIAHLLLAREYAVGAVPIMLWVAAGYAVSNVTQIVECRLMSLGHSARLILPMVLGAIANIGFSVALIRMHGIPGAAQATCASFIFQNVATVGFLVHALRTRRPDTAQGAKVEPA